METVELFDLLREIHEILKLKLIEFLKLLFYFEAQKNYSSNSRQNQAGTFKAYS